jgi:hypothetical protein
MAINGEMTNLKLDLEIKSEKLNKLECTIMDYAQKNRLWKRFWLWNRYKTFDDLRTGIKKAKWQQKDNLDPFAILRLTFIYGPKTLNDIIRPDVEKYNALEEEIEDIKAKLSLLKNEEIKTNPKAVTDDPDDNRNKWLNLNTGCFIKNQFNEYEIPNGKGQEFIDLCFERRFLNENDKKLDDFDIDWLFANVNVQTKRDTIRRYINNHRDIR